MLGYTLDDVHNWMVSLESVLNRPGTDKQDITSLLKLADFLIGLEVEGHF